MLTSSNLRPRFAGFEMQSAFRTLKIGAVGWALERAHYWSDSELDGNDALPLFQVTVKVHSSTAVGIPEITPAATLRTNPDCSATTVIE